MNKEARLLINITTNIFVFLLTTPTVFATEFNTDVLDASDRNNIDLTPFSRAGYIMPGQYQMEIRVNGQDISPSAFQITFLEPSFSGNDSNLLIVFYVQIMPDDFVM
ncbi:hypothetical protein D3C88_20110, partial [Escherichia coli]